MAPIIANKLEPRDLLDGLKSLSPKILKLVQMTLGHVRIRLGCQDEAFIGRSILGSNSSLQTGVELKREFVGGSLAL